MGFDRIALHYRWMESVVFGGALQRIRCGHLETFLGAESILLIGDGDGRFLKALLSEGCCAKIVTIDSSREMLKIAQSRIRSFGKEVCFVHSRIEDFNLPEGFSPDVIGAHFFLDCFSEKELIRVVDRISSWCGPQSKVVVSDFSIPKNGGIQRFWAQFLVCGMLLFFGFILGISARKLPNFFDFLSNRGWKCLKKKASCQGFLCSWIWLPKVFSERP